MIGLSPEQAEVDAAYLAWSEASHGRLLVAAGTLSRSSRGCIGTPHTRVDGDEIEGWCQDHGIPIVEGFWWFGGRVRAAFYLDPVDQDQEMMIKLRWL
ncbi:hypothetical protein SR39_25120 [Methylobacterium radiotolerans]|jgi:hypothetical protein|nr:hypothetical protein SR39_25120 [Methylobacterium radiotolerans]